MAALFQKDDKAGGCPYDCDVKEDVIEIKGDVKILVGAHHERIGAENIKKGMLRRTGDKPTLLRGVGLGVAISGGLVAIVVGIIGVM